MEGILRVVIMYVFLLIVFRLSGKRTLSDTTPFDLLLLLLISGAANQAIVGDDRSMTHAVIITLAFLVINVTFSVMKQRWPFFERLIEGKPIIVARDGILMREVMDKERIDEGDILQAARQTRGLERIEQIHLAVLERDGRISVLGREQSGGPGALRSKAEA